MLFPTLKHLKSLIELLDKSPLIGEIEIKEFGGRIYIRREFNLSADHRWAKKKEINVGKIAVIEPDKPIKFPKSKILILSDVVVPVNNYVVTKLPRNRRLQIWIPLFLRMSIAGTIEWYELSALYSPAAGIFNYTSSPGKIDQFSNNWSFLDFFGTHEKIGIVTTTRQKEILLYSREAGQVVSFQVLDGTEVRKKDIILIYAKKLSRRVVIPKIFEVGEKFVLPRNPSIQIYIPPHVPVKIGHSAEIYDLKPILASSRGRVHYINLESELKKGHTTLRPRQFFDFIVSGEEIATINSSENEIIETIKSPGPGYLVGFQVLNNTEVEPGDIIMLFAQKHGQ